MSLSIIRSFAPVVGKSGKVSTTANRAQHAVTHASSRAQLGLLVSGSALTRKTIQTGLDFVSLGNILSLPSMQGSDWVDLYAFLADKFGYKLQGDGNKLACYQLAKLARLDVQARQVKAESDGCTDAQYKRISADLAFLDTLADSFSKWQAYADTARNAATQAVETA